jgi:hypothetical protein
LITPTQILVKKVSFNKGLPVEKTSCVFLDVHSGIDFGIGFKKAIASFRKGGVARIDPQMR